MLIPSVNVVLDFLLKKIFNPKDRHRELTTLEIKNPNFELISKVQWISFST